MPVILLSITSLLAGTFLFLLGHGLAGTLLTLRAAADGYSDLMIGIIMAAYYGGYVIGTFTGPGLVNRIGHIRLFSASAALAGSIIVAHGLITNEWVWIILRIVYGSSIVTMYLVLESWLNARATSAIRGRVFAVYMLVNLFALSIGQLLLQLADISTLNLFAIASVLFSLSLIPLALTRTPEPERIGAVKADIRMLLRTAPLGLIACLMAGIAGGAFWSMTPLYTFQIGLTTAQTGYFMSAAIMGGALFQWPLGHWSDTRDRKKLLAIVAFLSAILSLLTLVAAKLSFQLLLLTGFVYGGMFLTVYPLSVAYSNDRNTPEHILLIGSTLLLTYGIGATVGPLIGGFVMQIAGTYSLPGMYAVCWLILGIYTLFVISREKPVPISESDYFVPAVRTTAIAIEVHAEEILEQQEQLHNAEYENIQTTEPEDQTKSD